MIKGRLLYLLSSETGLLFKNLSLFKCCLADGSLELLATIPCGIQNRLLSMVRLANRLKRLEPKCAGRMSETEYVLCMFGKIWLLDLETKKLSVISEIRNGFTVLNFCEYDGNLYFGDYGVNKEYQEINIYKLNKEKSLSVVYTFKPGEIRHIHNIVLDKPNRKFWIMAGDNEKNAGIYNATLDWKKVAPFATGDQKFRAVVAFPYEGGLIYATDSVEKENFIFKIRNDSSLDCIASINGSCIYGKEIKDFFVFSTTVESPEGTGRAAMLSNKLGGGIKSRDVHVISVNKNDGSVKILAKYRKDCWPMKLFQYGRMTFPGGLQDTSDLWLYNIACKKIDGKSFKIEL